MMTLLARCGRSALVLLVLLAGGCATGGLGGGVGYGYGYGVDYYEPYAPFGFGYDDWGPGYWVGPPVVVAPYGSYGYRAYGGARPGLRPGRGFPNHPPRAFRPAPPSHPMPTIPTAPRIVPHAGIVPHR